MSVVRNRELSQFGSFINIDDQSRSISITTGPTPNVGIGTTNPSVKFEVVGDTNIGGNLTVTGGSINGSSFILNGSPLVDASIDRWTSGSGSDIYRLNGNIGIGTSVISQKLTVLGNVSAGQFISTITSGTPLIIGSTSQVFNLNASLLAGKSAPAGNIVGTADTQTLTNKTLTTPTISSILNGGTLTLPTGTGTLIRTGSVGLVTSGMIAGLSLVNADIASNAGITYGKLNLSNSILAADIAVGAGITYGKLSLSNSITNGDIATNADINVSKLSENTISGITLGSNLATLTFGTYLTGTSYNGSTVVTIGINAETSGDSNIVARDGNGDFSAGDITINNLTATNGNFTGIVAASSFVGILTGTATGLSGSPNITISNLTATNGNFTGIVTTGNINVSNLTATGIVSDSYGNLRDIPQNSQSSTYSLQITDAGKHISITGAGVTVPSNVFSTGDTVTIFNNSSTNQTITQGSGVTLRFSGTILTGNRTILPYGIATVLCVSSNVFAIVGIVT